MKKWTREQRESWNQLRISNRSSNHINCIRVFKNNTYNHELAKFMLSWALIKEGHNIVTEAIFNNGKRADVVDLCCSEIYEVLESETKEQFLVKAKTYPEHFLVIDLKAEDIIKGDYKI